MGITISCEDVSVRICERTYLVIEVGDNNVVNCELYSERVAIRHCKDPCAIVQNRGLHEGKECALVSLGEGAILPLRA